MSEVQRDFDDHVNKMMVRVGRGWSKSEIVMKQMLGGDYDKLRDDGRVHDGKVYLPEDMKVQRDFYVTKERWNFTDDYPKTGGHDQNFHEGFIRRGMEVYEVTELFIKEGYPSARCYIDGLGWITIDEREIRDTVGEFDNAIELAEKRWLWE